MTVVTTGRSQQCSTALSGVIPVQLVHQGIRLLTPIDTNSAMEVSNGKDDVNVNNAVRCVRSSRPREDLDVNYSITI